MYNFERELEKTVNGRKLRFVLYPTSSGGGEIVFTVDRVCYHRGLTPSEGAAIIKASLRLWKEFLSQIPPEMELYCSPVKDEYYHNRVKIFSALGFSFISKADREQNLMTLTNRSKQFVRRGKNLEIHRKKELFLLLANQANY